MESALPLFINSEPSLTFSAVSVVHSSLSSEDCAAVNKWCRIRHAGWAQHVWSQAHPSKSAARSCKHHRDYNCQLVRCGCICIAAVTKQIHIIKWNRWTDKAAVWAVKRRRARSWLLSPRGLFWSLRCIWLKVCPCISHLMDFLSVWHTRCNICNECEIHFK